MELSLTNQGNFNFRAVWVFVVIVLAVTIGTIYSHATLKHDTWEVAKVRNCINDPNSLKLFFYSPNDDKYIILCQLAKNKWGKQVSRWDSISKYQETTAYIEHRLKSDADILKWIAKEGLEKLPGFINR